MSLSSSFLIFSQKLHFRFSPGMKMYTIRDNERVSCGCPDVLWQVYPQVLSLDILLSNLNGSLVNRIFASRRLTPYVLRGLWRWFVRLSPRDSQTAKFNCSSEQVYRERMVPFFVIRSATKSIIDAAANDSLPSSAQCSPSEGGALSANFMLVEFPFMVALKLRVTYHKRRYRVQRLFKGCERQDVLRQWLQ